MFLSSDSTVAVVAAYQNRAANAHFNQPSAVFGASVPLSTGKTVASVRLPVAGAVPIQPGTPSLHVFAAGIG